MKQAPMARRNLFIVSSFHWSHLSEKSSATALIESPFALPLWLRVNAVTNASYQVERCLSYNRPKSNDPFGSATTHHVSHGESVQMGYVAIVQMYDYFRSAIAITHLRAPLSAFIRVTDGLSSGSASQGGSAGCSCEFEAAGRRSALDLEAFIEVPRSTRLV